MSRFKSTVVIAAVLLLAVSATATLAPQSLPETGDWFDGSDDTTESSGPAESTETSESSGPAESTETLESSGPAESTETSESSNETEPTSVDQEVSYTTDFQYGPDACESGSDDDGLNMSEESQYGTNPCTNDTDGDGLSDYAEINREALSESDPTRMDVFVELDYTNGSRPKNETLQPVIQAYANSSVDNPDGSTGISLHIVVDDALPTQSDINITDGVDIMESHYDYVGDGYRYGLVVSDLSDANTTSGRVRTGTGVIEPGWNGLFIIEGSTWNRSTEEASGTLMHELGHSVGLYPNVYRGIDTQKESLRYDSIMHYDTSVIDYSHDEPFDEWQYIETSIVTPPVGNDTATIPAREPAE